MLELITHRRKRRLRVWSALLLTILLPASTQAGPAPTDVVGIWWLPNRSGKVQVFELDGRYVGRIMAYEVHGKRDEKNPDPDRWAACAFPDAYGASGTWTFIISHEGKVYKKDLGHDDGLEVYPADTVTGDWALMN